MAKTELWFKIHDDDPGFADVLVGIRGQHDQAAKVLEIDLWKVWEELSAIRAQVAADPNGSLFGNTVQYLTNLGMTGPISHRRANEFLKEHNKAIDEEGKAEPGGSRPDSPGSTAPGSSIAAPPSSSDSAPT